MITLSVKVLLAPSFVVLASLAGRRFGPRVGGLVGGLPVVGGPILLVYALAHGPSFASNAAAGTLLGIVSLMAFVVTYGHVAGRVSWRVSLLLGWASFAAATAAFAEVPSSALLALSIVLLALVLAPSLLPRERGQADAEAPRPRWDLPLRALAALLLVLALTAASGWLGPRLSGLLATFPVIASVLAAFTHGQRGGAGELQRLLRGLLLGYGGYALFCFTLAVSLATLGIALGFAVAFAVALLCQGALLGWPRLRARDAEQTAAAESPA